MIAKLKSTFATVTYLLLCFFICFSNTNPIASSADTPLQGDDFIFNINVQSLAIVIESHKLVFFPVPTVADIMWVTLLRHMMGFENWMSLDVDPHDDDDDGFVRLSDSSREQATEMMSSPTYTRVSFLRDPNHSQAEIETCHIDLNRTDNTGDMEYGLPVGGMTGRLFDEGHVLALLLQPHVGLSWM